MDIISYDKEEIDSKIARTLFYQLGFDKNPTLTRYISKLSNQYNNYKERYVFPTIYNGKNNFSELNTNRRRLDLLKSRNFYTGIMTPPASTKIHLKLFDSDM